MILSDAPRGIFCLQPLRSWNFIPLTIKIHSIRSGCEGDNINEQRKDYMRKKILLISLVFFTFGGGLAIADRSTRQDWLDAQGHEAPGIVRQAADALWDAAQAETNNADEAGMWWKSSDRGYAQKTGRKIKSNQCFCCWTIERDETRWVSIVEGSAQPWIMRGNPRCEAAQAMAHRFASATQAAYSALRAVVNNCVAQPVNYEGDADMGRLPELTKHPHSVWSAPFIMAGKSLVWRGPSPVVPEIMQFVNSRGGWRQ